MEAWSVWLCVMAFLIVSVTNWIHWWRNPEYDGRPPPASMGLSLIGDTLSFLVSSESMDIHPFVKERMDRFGPLFKTSLAGRQIVISWDPNFNYFEVQQEEKLVELCYVHAFGKLDHQNDDVNAGGYVHKYLIRVILKHFGSEPLKNKLLSQIEDAINHALHRATKQPEVDARGQTAAMASDMTSRILTSYEAEKSKENLAQNLCNILDGLMTFPLYIPGTSFYRCVKRQQKTLRLISELVEERRKSSNSEDCTKGDFLAQLMDDMVKEAFFTKEFVAYVTFGLLPASVETVSATTTLAIKHLLDNPSALQQLTEEHKEILKRIDGTNPGLSWEEHRTMTLTHYNIEGTATAKNFIAFGGGNRSCAGAEFSKVLMAVLLLVWVTKFRLTKIEGEDMAPTPVLKFTNGFYMKVSEK